MAKLSELLADDNIREQIAALQTQHPGKRLRPIDTAAGLIICVNPSRPQWTQFLASVWDDDKVTNAKSAELLLRAVTVHPERQTLDKWLDEYPGMASDPETMLELRKLAGAAKENATK